MEENTVYEYDDNFFLINPEHAIFYLYPNHSEYQLLARTVKREEFITAVEIRPVFFNFGFSILSHPKLFIEAKNSKCEIIFGVNNHEPLDLKHNLFISSDSGIDDNQLDDIKNDVLSKYVIKFYDWKRNRLIVQIRLPLQGTYKISFIVNSKFLLVYTIYNHSRTMSRETLGFPNSSSNLLGFNTIASRLKFKNMKPPIGVIDADYHGFACVSFDVDTKLYRIKAELKGYNEETSFQSQCLITAEDEECNIRIFLHKRGEYALNFLCKDVSVESDTYEMVFSYIINCRQDIKEKIIFPNYQRNGQIGITEHGINLGLKPIGCIRSFQQTSKTISYTFKRSDPSRYITKMRCTDFNDKTHELDTFTYHENDGKEIRVRINFPYQGMYHFMLFKEPEVSPNGDELFIGNFLVLNVENDCFEYPKVLHACNTLEPLSEIYKEETIMFKVKLPEAKSVAIIREPDKKEFSLTKVCNTWKGEADTGSDQDELIIVCRNDESSSYTRRLIYKVKQSNI